MPEFATNAKGNAALTTGIIGTAGFGLNWLSNLLGGGSCNGGNGANTVVNRYELEQSNRISKLESDVALRDANIYSDQKLLEVYKYFDGQVKEIRATISENDKAFAVNNAKVEGAFAVIGEKLNAQRNEFLCAINRERDERCCGDNAIVTYANATFYPKMVADVTTGTTVTAQPTYNPIHNCGCGCGR